jgi:hypothetical protein
MNSHEGQTISMWMTTATLPLLSTLIKGEHGEACILGAGTARLFPVRFSERRCVNSTKYTPPISVIAKQLRENNL